MNHINVVNKLLQSTTENIASALKVIDNTLIYIKKLRTDEGFKEIVATVVELVNCVKIPMEYKEAQKFEKEEKQSNLIMKLKMNSEILKINLKLISLMSFWINLLHQ